MGFACISCPRCTLPSVRGVSANTSHWQDTQASSHLGPGMPRTRGLTSGCLRACAVRLLLAVGLGPDSKGSAPLLGPPCSGEARGWEGGVP